MTTTLSGQPGGHGPHPGGGSRHPLVALLLVGACSSGGTAQPDNPIDRILAPKLAEVGLEMRSAEPHELCRRISIDLLGRGPSPDELAACVAAGDAERVELAQGHDDYLQAARRTWAELLGYDRKLNTLDHPASPRGYRILGRIPRLPKMVVQSIVSEFSGLDEILAAADPELESVEGVGDMRAKDIREGLRRLQEINLVDRYLQT